MACDIDPININPRIRPVVVDLRIEFPATVNSPQYAQGTGILIHPKAILTAGHNIFDPTLGGQAVQILARMGSGNRSWMSASSCDTTQQWQSQDSSSSARAFSGFDIGIVFLADSADANPSQIAFGALPDASLLNQTIFLNGYVGEDPPPFIEANARLSQVDTRRLYYPIRTKGGNSGGPVYLANPNASGTLVVGIHTSLVPETTVNGCGSATRITTDISSLINSWLTTVR